MMRWNHVIFLFWAWGSFGNVIYLEVISYLADGFSISSACISRRQLPHVFRASSATSPRRERWEFSNNAERSIDSSVECDSKDTPVVSYEIRDCTHKELSFVADLIVDSFYNYSSANTVWKQFTKLAELNRIQQNFPYGDDRAVHRMMVLSATSGNATTLCGFVDVDARKPNRHTSYKYNPRPYLSDLCIHPDYRRYGYATLLIQACEAFCRSELPPMAFSPAGYLRSDICAVPELYIRVETSNVAAEQMYQKLGYSIVRNHSDAGNDKIVILHKRL